MAGLLTHLEGALFDAQSETAVFAASIVLGMVFVDALIFDSHDDVPCLLSEFLARLFLMLRSVTNVRTLFQVPGVGLCARSVPTTVRGRWTAGAAECALRADGE